MRNEGAYIRDVSSSNVCDYSGGGGGGSHLSPPRRWLVAKVHIVDRVGHIDVLMVE